MEQRRVASTAPVQHSATLLPSGDVLVVGAFDSTTQIYDPLTNTWHTGGSLRVRVMATRLR